MLRATVSLIRSSQLRTSRDWEGHLADHPEVGKVLKMYAEDGRCIATTAVKRVLADGNTLYVTTENSTYRVVLWDQTTKEVAL